MKMIGAVITNIRVHVGAIAAGLALIVPSIIGRYPEPFFWLTLILGIILIAAGLAGLVWDWRQPDTVEDGPTAIHIGGNASNIRIEDNSFFGIKPLKTTGQVSGLTFRRNLTVIPSTIRKRFRNRGSKPPPSHLI